MSAKLKAGIILSAFLVLLIGISLPKITHNKKEIQVPYNTYYTEMWDIEGYLETQLDKIGLTCDVDVTTISVDDGFVVNDIMVFVDNVDFDTNSASALIEQSIDYQGSLKFYVKH